MPLQIEDAFIFCPLCGTSDFKKIKDTNYLRCQKCDFKHFLNPIAAISAIIINGNQEILLIKKAEGYRKDFWDTPGGFIDNTESLDSAIKREIKEELGVDSQMIEFFYAGNNPTYEYQNISRPVVGIFVTAKLLNNTIKVGDDASDFKWIPLNEVLTVEFAYPDVKEAVKEYVKKHFH